MQRVQSAVLLLSPAYFALALAHTHSHTERLYTGGALELPSVALELAPPAGGAPLWK